MLEILTVTYLKAKEITVDELHLMEHCVLRKIDEALSKKEIDDKGIILNAETFLDSFFVEIIYAENSLKKKLLEVINDLIFENKDFDLIRAEEEIILNEIQNNDLTSEELAFYKPLEQYSGHSINELYFYKRGKKLEELIAIFNLILCSRGLVYSNGDNYTKIESTDIDSIIDTNQVLQYLERYNNYVVGYKSKLIKTFREYIMASFYCFVFGQSDESFINTKFLKRFDLYLGYSINLIYSNSVLMMYLFETSDQSNNDINLLSFLARMDG